MQTVQYLCRKGQGSAHTNKMAQMLDVNPIWLERGVGPNKPYHLPHAPSQNSDYARVIQVPIINMADAINWQELSSKTGEFMLYAVTNSLPTDTEHLFAFEMQGESMQRDTGLSIPEGAMVIIAPGLEPQETKHKLALIYVEKDDKVVFRKLAKEPTETYLQTLKTSYNPEILPRLQPGDIVIGSMVSAVITGSLKF
ncbi:hypothetical protein FKG94_03190 [Exilibacterium tricleocarpae]|uniref:Peptidase S24/S26A/S26B/S26C domain-containing protein n=1 Tax=Exilibacterium tricleocarpae TaxID=2591008 RepID=A0A545U6V9_9GAMM|nr:S24 family peptidase [Exilibacterium tricleocarpae]TQV85208.1 hypothetical protein FKG94_03190 [Exilibacterium tricleocarpae]